MLVRGIPRAVFVRGEVRRTVLHSLGVYRTDTGRAGLFGVDDLIPSVMVLISPALVSECRCRIRETAPQHVVVGEQ